MKKIVVLLFISCLCANFSYAQSSSADSLKQYVGVYKMRDGSPVESYKITLNEGALFGEADGYGANKLLKQSATDQFKSTSSYGSIITFTRNADKKVTGLKMEIQGNELFADKKQE